VLQVPSAGLIQVLPPSNFTQNRNKIQFSLARLSSVIPQDLVQDISVQAVLERETPSKIPNLLPGPFLKTIRPLLDQEFSDEDVPAQPRDPVCEFPDRPWVKMLILCWDLLEDVVDERSVDLSDLGIVCSPCVDGEAVFTSEEVFEKGHVRCLWRDVDHALESDILIQPDRPAETILDRRRLTEEGSMRSRPASTNPVIDGKLVLEEMDTRFVDRVSGIALVLFSSIHGAPLPVPHA